MFVLCLPGEQNRFHVFPASAHGRGGRELPEERSKEHDFLIILHENRSLKEVQFNGKLLKMNGNTRILKCNAAVL